MSTLITPQEIEDEARQILKQWSTKWLWRFRLPGFLDLRRNIRLHLKQLMHDGPGQPYYYSIATKRQFGKVLIPSPTTINTDDDGELSLDELVIQFMVISSHGFPRNFSIAPHPSQTIRIIDVATPVYAENYDYQSEAVIPTWYEIKPILRTASPAKN